MLSCTKASPVQGEVGRRSLLGGLLQSISQKSEIFDSSLYTREP